MRWRTEVTAQKFLRLHGINRRGQELGVPARVWVRAEFLLSYAQLKRNANMQIHQLLCVHMNKRSTVWELKCGRDAWHTLPNSRQKYASMPKRGREDACTLRSSRDANQEAKLSLDLCAHTSASPGGRSAFFSFCCTKWAVVNLKVQISNFSTRHHSTEKLQPRIMNTSLRQTFDVTLPQWAITQNAKTCQVNKGDCCFALDKWVHIYGSD
jgi:hypothetical protein